MSTLDFISSFGCCCCWCWFVSFVPIFHFISFVVCVDFKILFFWKSSRPFSRVFLFHHFIIVHFFFRECLLREWDAHKKNELNEIKNCSTVEVFALSETKERHKNQQQAHQQQQPAQKRRVCVVYTVHRNHHAPKNCVHTNTHWDETKRSARKENAEN